MKNKIKLSIGLMLSIFTLFGSFAFATPASALTCRDVTLYGTVDDTGTPPTDYWFEYSTNYNTVANGQGTQTTGGTLYNEGFNIPVQEYISGLSESTTYYYQLVVQNDFGTYEGGIRNFATPSCQQNNPPTVSLSANPSSIQSGQSSTLSWSSSNANSCSASWSGSSSTSGSQTVTPSNTTTYNITCTNGTGQTANASATVNVNQVQNVSVNLTASPSNIQSGQASTLSWTSTNASSCIPSWSFWGTATSGSETVYPTVTTSYSISCTGNNGGSAYDTATVYVNQNQNNPTVNLSANPSSIQSGQSSTLSWSSSNANSCSASWSGSSSTSGSQTVTPGSTRTYSITCYGINGGQVSSSATVYVNYQNQTCQDPNAYNYGGTLPCRYQQVNNQPTVVVYADQASVPFNGTATVRWLSTNATSCFASGGSLGWGGAKSVGSGSFYTGSLTSSQVYSMTCSNNVGSASDSVSINVRGIVVNNPRPATSLVLISSTVDRQIAPTVDNTRPHPGDEINYTVNYQNIGTGAITGLTLQMNLPFEVDYMFSNPSNPTRSGNTLIFNLGTLRANGTGTVTVRVKVRENIPNGTNLNFPATLSYVDPSGQPKSVNANVTAQVLNETETTPATTVPLGANVFGAGFFPENLFGWLLLIVLVLALVLLAKHLFFAQPAGTKRVTTTSVK